VAVVTPVVADGVGNLVEGILVQDFGVRVEVCPDDFFGVVVIQQVEDPGLPVGCEGDFVVESEFGDSVSALVGGEFGRVEFSFWERSFVDESVVLLNLWCHGGFRISPKPPGDNKSVVLKSVFVGANHRVLCSMWPLM